MRIYKFIIGLIILAAGMLSVAFLLNPGIARAAPADQETSQPIGTVYFSDLGAVEKVMHGPYDSYRLRLSLPSHWALRDGVQLTLHLKAFYTTISGSKAADLYGGFVDVEYNGQLVQTVYLDWTGERTLTIPIPSQSLVPVRDDERHELSFFLNSAVDCEYDHDTTLSILPDSHLDFPYEESSPPVDLRNFPRPFYQENAVESANVFVIFPAQPSSAELQALLTISAGLSRVTSNRLSFTPLSESALTDEIRSSAHLIYVGKSDNLTDIRQVSWRIPWEETGFQGEEMQTDDGLVQIAVSP